METLKTIRKNKTLHQDVLILIGAMICVVAGIVITSVAGTYLVYDSFYQDNNRAQYVVTGPLAYELDGVPVTFLDVYTFGSRPLSVVAVITGYKHVDLHWVLSDYGYTLNQDLTQILPPLIFYLKPPSTIPLVQSVLRESNTFGIFSPNYTGLTNNIITGGPVEVYYHEWAGPQFSYEFLAFNETGSPILGKFYHDVTAGILFSGWMYYPINGMEGLSTIDLCLHFSD